MSQNKEPVQDLLLAEFFRKIAVSKNPMQQFYRGEIANKIVEEMRTQEGLITKADLVNYDARLESPLEVQVCNDFIIKGPRAPSILPLLLAAVKTLCEKYQNMNNLDQNEAYFDDVLKTQDILRDYLLDVGDPQFDFETNELQESLMQGNLSQILLERLNSLENQKDPTQKTNRLNLASEFLNVVDLEGNIVSYSASLTNKRGSLKRSKQYGFFWNNAMSAFNSNGGKDIINTIQGKKRPRTSLMPVILINRRTNEITSINSGSFDLSLAELLQTVLNHILLKKTFPDSISMGKLYSTPQGSTFDATVPLNLVSSLSNPSRSLSPRLSSSSSESAISILSRSTNFSISGHCRASCSIDGF